MPTSPPAWLSTDRPPAADLDVTSLRLQGVGVSVRVAASTMALDLDQIMEGASTLTLTLADYSGSLLRSRLLQGQVTVNYDGIDYVLVKLDKGDRQLTLSFEERAVNLLRQYRSPKKANRAKVTRAQFVRSMITEVTQARIPYQIPEVNQPQPTIGSAA